MSVLQLRRDMVVGDTSESVPADKALVTIDAPFPLRTINVTPDSVDTIEVEDEAPRKTFGQHARGWLRLIAALVVVGAYPTMVVMASNVGDHQLAGLVDRSQWTAPWAGGAAALMQRHTSDLGWASDAADWTPMARLTAKPALQHALAESLGDYITLMSQGAAAAGRPDSDLSAAARLVNINSTGVQMHAARDALVNFDRRERRRGAVDDATPAKLAAQLQLVDTWGARSQTDLAGISAMTRSGLIERSATEAVYKAKGRAQAAYVFIETMHWPEDAKSVAARNAALAAWKAAAEFHPLLVLNGSPDGSVLGNHAASMGFLIAQARKATTDYIAAIEAAPAPAAPVAIANAAAKLP